MALINKSKVILIIPPALFGKWAGHNMVIEISEEVSKLEDVSLYDFSESVIIPKFYYDHHHLNTEGIKYFTKEYLQPILAD